MEKVCKVSWIQISYTTVRTIKNSASQGIFRCIKMSKSYGAKFVEYGICFNSGIQFWPKIALLKILWRKMHCDDQYLVCDLICFVLFIFYPKYGAINISCLKCRSKWAWFWLLILIVTNIRDFSSVDILVLFMDHVG